MGQVSLGLRLDEDLLGRIDVARKDVPRARWIARACEAALPEPVIPEPPAVEQALGDRPGRFPTPAEQPLNRADLFRRATQR